MCAIVFLRLNLCNSEKLKNCKCKNFLSIFQSRSSRGSILDRRRPLRTPALTSDALDRELNLLQDTQNHFVEFDVKVRKHTFIVLNLQSRNIVV